MGGFSWELLEAIADFAGEAVFLMTFDRILNGVQWFGGASPGNLTGPVSQLLNSILFYSKVNEMPESRGSMSISALTLT